MEGSAEHESKSRVYEQVKITENTATIAVAEKLMEEILGHQNLMKACKRVISNKGSHGIDGMVVTDLMPYFMKHEEEIRETVLKGKYKPKPVRRVEIPKEDGTKRKLGVPTVIDRVIQQAMVQVLSPIYELNFRKTVLDSYLFFYLYHTTIKAPVKNMIEISSISLRGSFILFDYYRLFWTHIIWQSII